MLAAANRPASCCVSCGLSPEYSVASFGFAIQPTKNHSVTAVSTAPTASSRRCDGVSPLSNCPACPTACPNDFGDSKSASNFRTSGFQNFVALQRSALRDSTTAFSPSCAPSKLHARNFLIRGHNLVPHLHHELK